MSTYPDGTLNPAWAKNLRVAVPLKQSEFQVVSHEVEKVVCHRRVQGLEQYLLRWHSTSISKPHSWHDLSELSDCLHLVQDYVEGLSSAKALPVPPLIGQKRKTPDYESTASDSDSVIYTSARASPTSSTTSNLDEQAVSYNGSLYFYDSHISIQPNKKTTIELPTLAMHAVALRTPTTQAKYRISAAFELHLQEAASDGPALTVYNNIDSSRPPLSFKFIQKSVLGKGVSRVADDAVIGCGGSVPGQPQRCRPDMGQNIGCEYAKCCECMEYASVDEKRLTAEQKVWYEQQEHLMDLPKRFPYHATDPKTLQSFYLKSRAEIYECTDKCNCGPGCKTRCVQFGRQVPLEIFKTRDRGWGLRCTVDLIRGQFVDTYVGEIITNATADERERHAPPGKSSYLYNLDKYVCNPDSCPGGVYHETSCVEEDDMYVVDGEFMGNVTRFINHSCQPNLRQYTVSYNKYDRKVYELAFFAFQDIPAGTELTFDYMDRDDGGETEKDDLDMKDQMCKCGAPNCRGSFGFSNFEK